MKLIPQVKEWSALSGECAVGCFEWYFAEGTDPRVIRAAERLCKASAGTPVTVAHANRDSEGYRLTVKPDGIEIFGESAAGAFYALATLKMLSKTSDGKLACCEINDSPDMSYRGFYQDTTRGRIPKLETLKKLADTMADYKMNSLQLYVEHSYEFREYAFCREELGYLTRAEIMELDEYCKERFIELIPSMASFGHLYHLLQSEQYKHLCELSDYQPKTHYYKERMLHHTINPLLDESFALITSLLDQHMSAFTSNKFNICCDETFDLGRDVNKDHDKGELYVGFVKKLIAYLESKGKTVMMWGDIVLQHPEKISELSDQVVFLNWFYDENPKEARFEALKDCAQIVCPGTSTWKGFHERVDIEEPNILKLTALGQKYGAQGILNTNWGDLGNPASIDMAMYGLILGAAAGWDTQTRAAEDFKQQIATYHYGCTEAMEILTDLSNLCKYACWLTYHWGWKKYENDTEESFAAAQQACQTLIERIKAADFADPEMKKEFLIAAEGDSLLITWNAAKVGFCVPNKVDFEAWLKQYAQNWLEDSKQGELDEILHMFRQMQEGKA